MESGRVGGRSWESAGGWHGRQLYGHGLWRPISIVWDSRSGVRQETSVTASVGSDGPAGFGSEGRRRGRRGPVPCRFCSRRYTRSTRRPSPGLHRHRRSTLLIGTCFFKPRIVSCLIKMLKIWRRCFLFGLVNDSGGDLASSVFLSVQGGFVYVCPDPGRSPKRSKGFQVPHGWRSRQKELVVA